MGSAKAVPNGNDDDGLGIPPFLKVQNRVPLTKKQEKQLAEANEKSKEAEIAREREREEARQKLAAEEKAKLEADVRPRFVRNKNDDPAKPKKARASRDGLMSIGDIAKSLDMNPKEARGILRSVKFAKPACGWAFPADQVETVKKALQDGAKKTTSKTTAAPKKVAKVAEVKEAVFSGKAKSPATQAAITAKAAATKASPKKAKKSKR